MVSIKYKVAQMIFLASGQLARRCHALEAGILVEDIKLNRAVKTNKRCQKNHHLQSKK
jgi:hypothetical protein